MIYEEARNIIDQMRHKFRDSALTGQEKDKSFQGSIGAIYQTFDGRGRLSNYRRERGTPAVLCDKEPQFVVLTLMIAASKPSERNHG